MARLLVSVRCVTEARAAFDGGAALIDVKEPRNGPLGRAAPETIKAVINFVSNRKPVSAALGELDQGLHIPEIRGLAYAKWGLAECGSKPDWRKTLLCCRDKLRSSISGCNLVPVAYADWQRANAPTPDQVCQFACDNQCKAFLLDTWCKDGMSLLHWLSLEEICLLTERCRAADVAIALAGGLGVMEVSYLQIAGPDWFAVRGCVCRHGAREQAIEPDAVRELANLVALTSRGPLAKVDTIHSQTGGGNGKVAIDVAAAARFDK